MKTRYYDAAIALMSERGPGHLRLAELCDAVGLTTGSFYRHFENWGDFKTQFLADWLERRTFRLFEATKHATDPSERISLLIDYACSAPHRAEAAMRIWAAADKEVAAMQAEADRARTDTMTEVLMEVVPDRGEARQYAQIGLSVLAGFQQMYVNEDTEVLRRGLMLVYDHLRSNSPRSRRRAVTATSSSA